MATKSKRLQVRITDLQKRRIALLMEKTALDGSGVVNSAIKEKFDREIGAMPEEGRTTKKKQV